MIFWKQKFKSHAEYDKAWAKLSREDKDWGLNEALRNKQFREDRKKMRARVREAEKGKDKGNECTCLPEHKNVGYVDLLCKYCQYRH